MSQRSGLPMVAVFFILLCLVSIPSCNNSPSTQQPETVMVRVNGDPITEEAVTRRIQSMRGTITKEDVNPNSWQRLTEAAIELEILDLLLLQAAKKEGTSVSAELVNRDLARTRKMMGDDAYRAMLKKRAVDEDGFRTYLEQRILLTRYKERLFEKIELSVEELEDYYEGHPQRFAQPELYRLHILEFPSSEESLQALENISQGKSFQSLAQEHTAGGGRSSRTRPMPLDAMPDGMKEVVSASFVGEVVRYDGVGTSYIIKVMEKIQGVERTFEEAREDVRVHLYDLRKEKNLDDWYRKQLGKSRVEYIHGQESKGK